MVRTSSRRRTNSMKVGRKPQIQTSNTRTISRLKPASTVSSAVSSKIRGRPSAKEPYQSASAGPSRASTSSIAQHSPPNTATPVLPPVSRSPSPPLASERPSHLPAQTAFSPHSPPSQISPPQQPAEDFDMQGTQNKTHCDLIDSFEPTVDQPTARASGVTPSPPTTTVDFDDSA